MTLIAASDISLTIPMMPKRRHLSSNSRLSFGHSKNGSGIDRITNKTMKLGMRMAGRHVLIGIHGVPKRRDFPRRMVVTKASIDPEAR